MAYRQAPNTELDWLTAAIMGEAATEGPQGMAAVADVLMNRSLGTLRPNTDYGNDFTYSPSTIAGQYTAYQRGPNGSVPQFSSYDRDQAAREGNGSTAAYTNFVNALNRGAAGFSGSGLNNYNQARSIAETFINQDNPNYGRYRGVSGGSDFFVAQGFPSAFLRNDRYQSQPIGNQDFFRLKSLGGFVPYSDPGDRGAATALPLAGSDGVGDGFNVSGGVQNGNFGTAGGTFETGNPFAFSQGNFSVGVDNGSFGAGMMANAPVDGFGNGYDVSSGLGVGPGSFTGFDSPFETGNPFGFSAADASGGVGNGAIGQPLDPYADASATAFAAGFDPSAYIQANPDVAAAGVDPLQHWLRFGQAEGRPLTPNANPFTGNANGALAPISADFSGSPLSPVDTGNPIASPTPITADFGSPLAPVPTGPNVSQGVAPGSFQGTFNGANYLAANQDLAGLNVDPLQHYLTYGFQEGRALDTAGDRISQGFDPSAYLQANPDVAASGLGALQHYIMAGAHEGRATNFSGGVAPGSFGAGIVPAPSMQSPMDYGAFGSIDVPAPIAGGNFGADLSPVSTGPNVSASVGPGTFHGTFNGADYLAANQDVAAANVDPLTHYLTYGFNEGRAIDTAGDRINRGFDPTQYLATNPDVAAAHVDPLRHYLESGAAEGRALPTGSNPYSFANFNASQGLGPVANGAMGFGGLGSMGGGQGMPDLGYDGGGFDASGGVPNGSFGLGGVTAGSPNYGGGYSPFNGGFNPYGFSGANVGGGLGATAQSMGGYYPAGGGQGGGGGIDPYGFSQANVGGFDPNSLGGGAPVEDFGSGAGLGPTQWNDAPQAGGDGGGGGSGFNSNASELAYLRGQLDQQYAANARLADSNNTNIAFANQGAAQANQLNATGAGNAAKQFAGIQAGLGITPVAGVSFAPGPVGIQTIGGIGPMNFGLAGLGGAPLRGFL